MKLLIDKINFKIDNILFYQCTTRLTAAQIKNLGIDFSKGSWLFFMDYQEIITEKFIYFIIKYKFNLQNAFYRVSTLNEKRKKIKMGFLNPKYYSDFSSSFIINEEFIERIQLRWETTLNVNETLLFMDKLYSAKNVNFSNLKKCYSVIHNFVADAENAELNNFENIKKSYYAAKKQNTRNYKQIIILMFYYFIKRNKEIKTNEQKYFKEVSFYFKESKIKLWNYFPLGFKLFFGTFKFRIKIKKYRN